MSDRRDKYFSTLNLLDRSGDWAKAALKRAYQLRDFEIEHYWRRATYFWAFQVAIFAAFGLLWKETGTKPGTNPVTGILAGLGILTALANALSARGSRFWQNNWEKHIDMLEDEIEGRLYKTVWLSEGTVIVVDDRAGLHRLDLVEHLEIERRSVEAGAIDVAAAIRLYRVADTNVGLILMETRQFPGDATCFCIERNAQTPHDIRATASIEGQLSDDLYRYIRWRAEGFEVVAEIKRLSFEARLPGFREIDKGNVKVAP